MDRTPEELGRDLIQLERRLDLLTRLKLLSLGDAPGGKYGQLTLSDQIISYLPDGTPPLEVISGTMVPNLNADVALSTHSASGKTTPVDADELPLVDSAASNGLKKLTWANLKATVKAYFDTLYPTITNKYHNVTWVISNPAIDTIPGQRTLGVAGTVIYICGYAIGGTSVTFNIEKRAAATGAGTNFMASDLTLTTGGVACSSFADDEIPAHSWLLVDISAVSGAVEWVMINLTYRVP